MIGLTLIYGFPLYGLQTPEGSKGIRDFLENEFGVEVGERFGSSPQGTIKWLTDFLPVVDSRLRVEYHGDSESEGAVPIVGVRSLFLTDHWLPATVESVVTKTGITTDDMTMVETLQYKLHTCEHTPPAWYLCLTNHLTNGG